MRFYLLTLTVLTGMAVGQDRVEFDLRAADTGSAAPVAPPQPWPASTEINQVGRVLVITWTGEIPVETLYIHQVSHIQRARAFDTFPDQLFLVLTDGRRILLSQGAEVANQVALVAAALSKEVEALPTGEGHIQAPAGKTQVPTVRVRAGDSGISVTSVGLQNPTADPDAKPAIRAGGRDASVDGVKRMGPYEIDKHIRPRMKAIGQCYQTALQAKPGLSGKVTVGFVVTRDGTVGAAAIQASTLNNVTVENCIRSEILSIQFPPPATNRPIQVTYPFVFSSK